MKKVKLFLLIAILCTSCSTSKMLISNVKPVEITEMVKIEPFSHILLVEKWNKSEYSDSVSNSTKIILNESLETFREGLRLSSEDITMADSLEREQLLGEINFLIAAAESSKSIENIQVTPLIDSLLSANNQRFGLIIFQNGFSRTKGNFVGQALLGAGIGILTLGTAYYYPIKSRSVLYAMIIDNQNKNIAFYKKSDLESAEPTEKRNIIKQLDKIFEKYFW